MLNTTMPYRFVAVLAATLTIVSFVARPAQAQDAKQEIRTLLEQRDHDLKQAIKPLVANPKAATEVQKEKVQNLINGLINFEEMGRQALGPFWKDLTTAQRNEFVRVFGGIVRSQSLADLDVYNSKVAYEEIKVVGDSAYVRTTTTYEGKPAKVEYYLGKADGTWAAHNIVLNDVGTVEGYARSFQAVIRKRGFDALMKSLYKKLEQVQEAS